MTESRRVLFAATAAAGALACVYIARGAADSTATSDTAVIESFTMLASQGRLLLGPYSRFQWHHPGPIYFFWMAPFYVLSGSRTTGLNAGALALNVGGLALVAVILLRRASRPLASAAGVALALLIWRVPDLLISPWNPHVPVVATIVMLVAAAEAMCGAALALPLVALSASLGGQTHVALLPLSLAVGAVATLGFVVATWRAPDGPRRVLAALLATGAVIGCAWAPSLFEQFAHRPGNLGLIWTFFVSESHAGQSLSQALSAWADMVTGPVRPDFYLAHGWRFVESPVRWAEALASVEVLSLAAAAYTSRRAGRAFDANLSGILLGASLLSLWSATRIDGEIFDHAVFWIAGIGVLNLAMMCALFCQVADRWVSGALGVRWVARWVARASCAAVLVVAASGGVSQLRAAAARSFAPDAESKAASEVAGDLRRLFHDEGVSRPLIRFDQDAWGMVAGVVLRLQKEGVAVAVEDDWIAMFTPAFAATGGEAVEIAIVGKAEHLRLSSRPGDRVVASRDILFAHRVSR